MAETYTLTGHLDSAAATPLTHELLKRRGTPLCIDASAVVFAGTLPFQILIAAQKQWHDDGLDFKIAPLSPEFSAAAKGLGVDLSMIGACAADIVWAEGVS